MCPSPAAGGLRRTLCLLRRTLCLVQASALLAGVAVSGCTEDQSSKDFEARRSPPAATSPDGAREGSAAPRRPPRRFAAVVALERADTVALLRGPPWGVARRFSVPAGPHNVAVSRDGRWAAVSSPPANRVTLVDVLRRRVLAHASVSGGPHDVSFSRDGRAVWVSAERARRVAKLSVPGGRLVHARSTAAPPHDLRVTPDGRRLWVTLDGSGAVEIRSAGPGRLLARAAPGGAPHDLAFEPGRRRVWFSNWSSGSLSVASTRTGRRLAELSVGAEPHHLAFGLGCLWVSDNDRGALIRIGSDGVRGATEVGPSPHHVAVAGRNVLVAVNGSGRVAVVAAGGRLVDSVAVGAGPHGIAAAAPDPAPPRRTRCR